MIYGNVFLRNRLKTFHFNTVFLFFLAFKARTSKTTIEGNYDVKIAGGIFKILIKTKFIKEKLRFFIFVIFKVR